MSIQVLASDVISKIAAGEVIERPASVVKELVENSIDAGANQITVEVSGDGTQLIRVTDNGVGISTDEVEIAFQRHATSKITSESDLETVFTLGFRGEALPTIASVAGVSVTTKFRDDVAGTSLTIENGEIVNNQKQGCPQGTAFTIRNLFQNVPARLKFLKAVSTENSHISNLVTQYSMAYPEVKFSLTINNRNNLRTPGNGNLRDTLVEVYGLQTAQSMLKIKFDEDAEVSVPRVGGFVSPSSVTRSNRNYLSFFVNRRWVQSRMLNYAVEEAYQGMLLGGKHPIAVINISIPPEDIDVNVHPSKSEVKFRRDREVFSAVQKAVRGTLIDYSPVPKAKISQPLSISPSPASLAFPMTEGLAVSKSSHMGEQVNQFETLNNLPILRVIGQFRNSYIIAEGPDGMYVIDQHAGHERVLYEKVLQQNSVEIQGMLEPMTVDLTARQAELVNSEGEVLTEAGFSLEQFGERTFLLRAVPSILNQQDILKVLTEILDSLGGIQKSEWKTRVAASLACHSAIKAGQTLSQQEMVELINQLEGTTAPRTCPHGRPTVINFSAEQLESEFGRR